MGLWSNFKASLKKSKDLQRLTTILGAEPSFEPVAFMRNSQQQAAALEELLTLIEADNTLVPILKQYGATRDKLRASYQMLCLFAGHWVGPGHWVPASALWFGTTLPYVLVNADEKDEPVWMEVCETLTEYYKKNGMRIIPPVKARA